MLVHVQFIDSDEKVIHCDTVKQQISDFATINLAKRSKWPHPLHLVGTIDDNWMYNLKVMDRASLYGNECNAVTDMMTVKLTQIEKSDV